MRSISDILKGRITQSAKKKKFCLLNFFYSSVSQHSELIHKTFRPMPRSLSQNYFWGANIGPNPQLKFFKTFSFSGYFFIFFFYFSLLKINCRSVLSVQQNLFLIKEVLTFLLMPVRRLYDSYFVLSINITMRCDKLDHLVKSVVINMNRFLSHFSDF